MTARGPSAKLPHPSSLQAVARGDLLFVGGLVVTLAVEPVGPKKPYWVPLIVGLTYLVSSAAGGGSGDLWLPVFGDGLGVGTTTVPSGTIRAPTSLRRRSPRRTFPARGSRAMPDQRRDHGRVRSMSCLRRRQVASS